MRGRKENGNMRYIFLILVGIVALSAAALAGDIYKSSVLLLNATGGVKIIGGGEMR